MKQVRVTANFQVTGGSKLEAAKDFEVQSVDDGEIIVPFATEDGPSEYPCTVGSGAFVKFLAIKPEVSSADYDSLELSYKVYDQNDKDSGDIQLTEPHVFIGSGAVSALGKDIEKIVFTNEQTKPEGVEASGITISMMIGRDVASSPKLVDNSLDTSLFEPFKMDESKEQDETK